MTFDETPIFRGLAADRVSRGGRHRWRDDPPTGPIRTEVPVARHHDHDGDGIADQADPDWLPAPPEPVTPLGPPDPEDEAYSRTGNHEPPRWPEPAQHELDTLVAAAADVDDDWLAVASQPISPGDA